jgi:hypothetical protein
MARESALAGLDLFEKRPGDTLPAKGYQANEATDASPAFPGNLFTAGLAAVGADSADDWVFRLSSAVPSDLTH